MWLAGGGGTGHAWTTIVGLGVLVGREQAPAVEDATRHRDPDRGIAVRAAQALGGKQLGDAGRQRAADRVGQDEAEPRRRPTQPVDVLLELRGGRRALGGSRRRRHRAGSRDRTRGGAARRPAGPRPLTQTKRGPDPPVTVPRVATATSRAPIAPERSARLGHRLVPLVGRVAAPRDAAADVQREPLAVGHEGPDQDARPHRAIGPDPARAAGVRARGGPARGPRGAPSRGSSARR